MPSLPSPSPVSKKQSMRLLLVLIIILIVEAKRKQSKSPRRSRTRPPSPQDVLPAVNLEKYPVPVDFLHIGKEGVFDPASGLKQPFDGLARALIYPMTAEEELRMVQNADPTKLEKIYKGPRRLQAKPRKEDWTPRKEKPLSIREYNPDLEEMDTNATNDRIANVKMPQLFDLESVQNINFASEIIYKSNIAKGQAKFKRKRPPGYDRQIGARRRPPGDVKDAFQGGSFRLKGDINDRSLENWTTCEEFSKNASFHPREVAGVEWVAFYAWSRQPYPRFFDYFFSYPTAKVVEEYKTAYRSHLGDLIDWRQPMLLLKAWEEILLVAGDRRGLFHGIPKTDIPEQNKNSSFLLPVITMRIKLVDPYLAIMFCEENIAVMLAVAGEGPSIENMETEAAKLGFRGIGERVIREADDIEDNVEKRKTLLEQVLEENQEEMKPRRPSSPFFHADPMFP